ncbi:MAG: lasso RiPP family leader peptide-containing protein [Alphaproteobacteria bacterium]|nr:lasso RiPP family leader peptide-containing protein [Alphaproteobacteria bacterium]
MKTASLETKGQAPATAKKPYEAPVLNDWGTLEELTLANGNKGKSDGGRPPHSRTR